MKDHWALWTKILLELSCQAGQQAYAREPVKRGRDAPLTNRSIHGRRVAGKCPMTEHVSLPQRGVITPTLVQVPPTQVVMFRRGGDQEMEGGDEVRVRGDVRV